MADIRCVKNFNESNNCVTSFGTAKTKIKIVRIDLKSTFLYIMQLMSEKFLQRHSKNFKNKFLASKYDELFPTFSACLYIPRLHLFYSTLYL